MPRALPLVLVFLAVACDVAPPGNGAPPASGPPPADPSVVVDEDVDACDVAASASGTITTSFGTLTATGTAVVESFYVEEAAIGGSCVSWASGLIELAGQDCTLGFDLTAETLRLTLRAGACDGFQADAAGDYRVAAGSGIHFPVSWPGFDVDAVVAEHEESELCFRDLELRFPSQELELWKSVLLPPALVDASNLSLVFTRSGHVAQVDRCPTMECALTFQHVDEHGYCVDDE
jgi:hypothetical protein